MVLPLIPDNQIGGFKKNLVKSWRIFFEHFNLLFNIWAYLNNVTDLSLIAEGFIQAAFRLVSHSPVSTGFQLFPHSEILNTNKQVFTQLFLVTLMSPISYFLVFGV